MDKHVKEFFSESSDENKPDGNFHRVIALHTSPEIKWKEISKKAPTLPRGWYELAHLSIKDRIEFLRDFWLAKLPYRAGLDEILNHFFSTLDDIGIYITQTSAGEPYKAQLIYSLKNNTGFYRGSPPASDEDVVNLQSLFLEYVFPKDYIAFLQIHDGFWKTTDTTGLTRSDNMFESYAMFQSLIKNELPMTRSSKEEVNPKSLIPFYESFGMPYYQCFWGEWYPEDEMGNVYYSSESKTISDVKGSDLTCKSMAFPTFTDWLMFYLEPVE